jgi:hypothetical protein
MTIEELGNYIDSRILKEKGEDHLWSLESTEAFYNEFNVASKDIEWLKGIYNTHTLSSNFAAQPSHLAKIIREMNAGRPHDEDSESSYSRCSVPGCSNGIVPVTIFNMEVTERGGRKRSVIARMYLYKVFSHLDPYWEGKELGGPYTRSEGAINCSCRDVPDKRMATMNHPKFERRKWTREEYEETKRQRNAISKSMGGAGGIKRYIESLQNQVNQDRRDRRDVYREL